MTSNSSGMCAFLVMDPQMGRNLSPYDPSGMCAFLVVVMVVVT